MIHDTQFVDFYLVIFSSGDPVPFSEHTASTEHAVELLSFPSLALMNLTRQLITVHALCD